MKTSIRKDDVVIVLKGKDRGKTGKVLKITRDRKRAIVEKINFAKEFIRPDQSRNIQGGIMEKEAPVSVANLMVYCSECGGGVRVNKKVLDDGSKIRVCNKCGASLERH
ncbi:MAG: 50S ribosomal protein L24 [Candidatus Aminicenantales bacterium]